MKLMSLDRVRALAFVMAACLFAARPAWVGAQPEGDAGEILLISDIHFDPFYDPALFDQLAAESAEHWGEVLARSQPPGFNARGTDSNNALLQSSLDAARKRIPRPDFILFPGDFLAHQWQSKYDARAAKPHSVDVGAYQDFTTKAIRYLAGEFRRRFPDTPILPTLGNDDSYCGDYMIEPDGAFLRRFVEVWGPLFHAGDAAEADALRESFHRCGDYTLRLPGAPRRRLVVLNSVFFSVNYDDRCGTTPRTPGLEQLRWLSRTLERARAAGESVWLLMHIPPGINSYNTVEVLTRDGTPATFWQPELTSLFLRLIERHAETIALGFVGHTHMDDFRVIRLAGKPSLLLKITPAISPIFGNNPGFQVYQIDRATGLPRNFQTYYLTSLAGDGSWMLEYDFLAAYGVDALNAATVAGIADRMKSDPGLQRRYTTFYGVSAPPEFTPATFPIYRAAIANVTPAEFLKALTGGPPRPASSTPRHPDRRRTLAPIAVP